MPGPADPAAVSALLAAVAELALVIVRLTSAQHRALQYHTAVTACTATPRVLECGNQ
jgi:hypothetical protein